MMKYNAKTNKKSERFRPLFLSLIIVLTLIFHADTSYSLDVDFYDNYCSGGCLGLSDFYRYDRINWIDNTCTLSDYWITLGVYDATYDVYGYCVNPNKNQDSNYDFCLVKNSTYDECSDNMPVFPLTETETADNWAEADQITQYTDVTCGGHEGNTYFNDTYNVFRGQIEYYGYVINEEIDSNPNSENNGRYYVGNDTRYAQEFEADFDYLRYIDIDFRDEGIDTITLRLRDELTSADLETATVNSGTGWQRFDIEDYELTPGEDYFIILDCEECGDGTGNKWEWEICDIDTAVCNATGYKGYQSTDYGASFHDWKWAFAIRLYGGDKCDGLGTTSDTSIYDYYYVDLVRNDCDYDGSQYYGFDGRYAVSSYTEIKSISCGATKICDEDHDDDTSSSPSDDYTDLDDPCRLKSGEPCSDSDECWNNAVCDGADTVYFSNCDGELVDVYHKEWSNSCGSGGVLIDAGTLEDNDQDCEVDGGFPNGYRCEDNLDDVDQDTKPDLFNLVCKGGVGNSCTVDSDCYHDLNCIGGFCDYYTLAVLIPNATTIYAGSKISFDDSLSVGSDDNIQYACYQVDGVNSECDGNATQCSGECNGANYDNALWDDGFIKTFNTGGNYDITLIVGSKSLYSDDAVESVCVSGDGNYCYSCFDGLLNDDETSIDWGGHCGTPYGIRCLNGVLDNVTNETSIDYGGVCGNCDNTSISEDLDLEFLKESGLITYPFDSSLCEKSQATQGFVAFFVFLLSSILIVPLLFLLLVFVLLLLLGGSTALSLLVGIVRKKRGLSVLSKIFEYVRKARKK